MPKLNAATRAYLDARHSQYCDFNQTAPDDGAKMVAAGHPNATAYAKLRGFFDGLRYACNSRARFFSFNSLTENSEYWAPELKLAWSPSGPEFQEFRTICRADDNWDRYIVAVAASGWPTGAGPGIDGGSWLIKTKSEAFATELSLLRNSTTRPEGINVHFDFSAEQQCYRVGIHLHAEMTPAFNRKLLVLIRKHHKGYILPKRRPEQDILDAAALPLAEKKFSFGSVKEVTVTERFVTVPLVALPADKDLVLTISNKLLSLVDAGYPFNQVADWLKQFLTPASFRELQELHGS